MRFQNPSMLATLVLIPVLWVIWTLSESHARKLLSRFLSSEMLARLRVSYSKRRKTFRFYCLILALFFAVIALARPQMGTKEETVSSTGLDIVFMLDVSTSMCAEDVVPSRIKKAKHIIRNFLERLSGDRVGVVGFAGSAYQAVPMTVDYEYVKQVLEILDEKSVQNQGTNIAKALQVAFDLLKRGGLNQDVVDIEKEESAGKPRASKVLIVLSDGEDTVLKPDDVETATSLSKQGVRIYSIGVGSLKGSPIPIRDQAGGMQGFKKNRLGSIVLTKLESRNLEAVSSKAGGRYYTASSDEGEVAEIVSELTGLDRTEGEGRKIVLYEEFFQYPLALSLGFIFLIIGTPLSGVQLFFYFVIWAPLGTFGRTVQASSLNEFSETKKGLKAYELNDYPEAIRRFGTAQADNPDLGKHRMNMGAALYKTGSLDGAIKQFNSVLQESQNVNEAAKGAYNLGKIYDVSKDHDKAIRSYQDGLNRLMDNPEAEREVVERLKRALQVSQQKKQQQENEKKEGQKGDDEKKSEKKSGQKDEQKNEKDEQQNKQVRNPKPKFEAEKLTEMDAKRLLKQLQENEKKTQVRLLQKKSMKTAEKMKETLNDKDW